MSPLYVSDGKVESLSGPIFLSATCHGCLIMASLIWNLFNPTIQLGSRNAGQGSGIVAVQGVPINVVRSEQENPVANQSQHSVPAPRQRQNATQIAEPEPVPQEAPAVPVPERQRQEATQQQELAIGQRSSSEAKENQIKSSRGAALSSRLYNGATVDGAVGFGRTEGGPFGSRFGWYAEILQRAIAEQWQETLGQVTGGTSKPVITSFRILKSGQFDLVRIMESSGNRSLDYSALRAISNASPLRPLPTGLGRQSIIIEMHFQLN